MRCYFECVPRFVFAQRILVIIAIAVLVSPALSLETKQVRAGIQSSTTISGLVFHDYDSDGIRDTATTFGHAVDNGVGGIIVRAFDSTGVEVANTNSASDGTYTLNITESASTEIRVEFTIPSDDPILSAYTSSFASSKNGVPSSVSVSSVQFVNLGDENINYSVHVPGEYCQNSPNIGFSRQCFNEPTDHASVWVSQYNGGPYLSGTDLYSDWAKTQAARQDQTESILGMAWHKQSKRILSSAYVRRGAKLYESNGKPLPGALFSTNPTGTTATSGTGGTTSFLVDLEALMAGDQFSSSNVSGPGYIPTNLARFGSPANFNVADSDIASGTDGVYEEVGKAGIGDMDVDDEGNLYVVSLFTRKLYKVPLPANGSAPTSMSEVGPITSTVTCTNGVARPFGVTHWRNNLYMGVVCDGSSDFAVNAPVSITDDRNITYSVVRYSLQNQTWSTFVGPYPLYAPVAGQPFKGSPIGDQERDAWQWNPWTDTFSAEWESGWAAVHPMPLASDIQFAPDGSLTVSLRDRFGDMMSQAVKRPDNIDSGKGGISAGDLYRICRTGDGWTASDYVWEGNAGCSRTHRNFDTIVDGYYINEFFRDDYGTTSGHADQSAGMLEQVPGFRDVLNSAMDPYIPLVTTDDTWSSGGISYYLNATGARQTSVNAGGGVIFAIAKSSIYGKNTNGFNKMTSMGDIEALCDMAPIQIGNRLWFDADGDGIQDPGEEPIVGATVRLYDVTGTTLISTAVTNEYGEYYFSSTQTEADTGGISPDAYGGNIQDDTPYVIKLDNPVDYQPGGALYGSVLTEANAETPIATDNNNGIDSDATADNGIVGVDTFPSIAVNGLQSGMNQSDIDIGFVPLVGVGDYTWIDIDADGIQDAGELPLSGVTIELLDANGDPARDAMGNLVQAQITDANGYYFFDGLLPGDYQMKFTAPDGYALTVAGEGVSSDDSNPDRITSVTPIFSIAGTANGDTVVDTDAETLARFVNPTIDAGVVPVVSVGDYVWRDLDRDGMQDAGEPGIEGVSLTITNADGSPVVDVFGNTVTSTTTDSSGKYTFDNLPPGQYTVAVTTPPSMAPTVSGVGALSSDSSTSSATSVVLTDAGQRDPTLDFGFVDHRVSVGDYVWFDLDRDGVQESGEPPLAGVTLTISNADGSPVIDVFGNPVTSTTTDTKGKYSFDNLPVGQYTVSVVTPAGFESTVSGRGTTATDSSTGSATSMVLTQDGQRDDTLDFGFWAPPAVVGSRVWHDQDSDGIQDVEESGVPNVMVSISDINGFPVRDLRGQIVQPVRTDASGNFLFSDLPLNQQYKLTVTYPAGARATIPGEGDAQSDSSTLFAVSRRLTANNPVDLSLDFGVIFETEITLQTQRPSRLRSAPRVTDQYNKVLPDGEAWLDPSALSSPSTGARWLTARTRIWDASTGKWVSYLDTPQGTWSVLRGEVRFVPAQGFRGTATVPFQMTDSTGQSISANLYVTSWTELPATGFGLTSYLWVSILLLIAGGWIRRHGGMRIISP